MLPLVIQNNGTTLMVDSQNAGFFSGFAMCLVFLKNKVKDVSHFIILVFTHCPLASDNDSSKQGPGSLNNRNFSVYFI